MYLPAGIFMNEKHDKFITPYFIIFNNLLILGGIFTRKHIYIAYRKALKIIYNRSKYLPLHAWQ